ncbi:uncharacterized protein LOC122505183 isoform X2 [Leptopilina heterotoma]|uniref:uncharacterized protein LOC122505183 isoform X2 n=1 Tax=Leptopilina heterotoma TaxID=63436 RepID=UPI001CA8ED7F|nr:uncharacterized protein LOC122505183 isoform X2 [Leptopilina heterotoma]
MNLIVNFIFVLIYVSISTNAYDATDGQFNLESGASQVGNNIDNNSTKLGQNSADSPVYNEGSSGNSSGISKLNEKGEVTATEEMGQYRQSRGNIVAGGGYSSDMQQIVAQLCYNATISSTTDQQTYIQLNTALTYSELESKLGISISASGKYAMFSAEAKANYMRSIQDKDYSTSLNYFEYSTNNVAVQLAGYGTNALTESGKDIYKDGKNKFFGLVCGDHYITSYQQGALLTMGLNIRFTSSNAKQKFEARISAKFGNIASAAGSIEAIASKHKITGSVIIQAFQMGGEPSQLSKILNKDNEGQYYALTCSLLTMTNCISAASGLLDYARDEFTKQFSFQTNTGLTPLGIAFTQYNPIEYIGLSSDSLVTQEVINIRNELSSKVKENEYYQEKLHPFFNNGYFHNDVLENDFLTAANLMLSKTKNNLAVLMDPHGGAVDCFNYPNKCRITKSDIDSRLETIESGDFKFLDRVKYKITIFGGALYLKGAISSNLWIIVPNDKLGKNSVIVVKSCFISDHSFDYNTLNPIPAASLFYEVKYSGNLTSNGREFKGSWCYRCHGCHTWATCIDDYIESILLSEFFFESYTSDKKTEIE